MTAVLERTTFIQIKSIKMHFTVNKCCIKFYLVTSLKLCEEVEILVKKVKVCYYM